jgi:hypothetical protein
MNPDQYSCNVVIAGLMALLSAPASEKPVYLWGSDSFNQPVEIDFRYGNFKVEYDGINSPSMHTKVLQLITEGDIFVPFMRGRGFLDVRLI